jgi:hypothetical protein
MWNWMMMGLESNRVIGLRIAKFMRGGKRQTAQPQHGANEDHADPPLAGLLDPRLPRR